jgi:hypothetical protein
MKKTKKRMQKRTEPSAASLREMPEVDFSKAKKSGRGHYHRKAVAAGGYGDGPDGKRWVPLTPGRPPKGIDAEATSPKSIRLPEGLWERLDREAKKRGTTRHRLLRELIAAWLERAA